MCGLADHLVYLSRYATGFMEFPEVQEALSSAYGDVLEFCKGARNVFTDKEGNQSRELWFLSGTLNSIPNRPRLDVLSCFSQGYLGAVRSEIWCHKRPIPGSRRHRYSDCQHCRA